MGAFVAQYWYLIIFFILLCILTVFLCYKAAVTSSQRSREKREFLAKLDREKKLREAFSQITAEVIDSQPQEDVFEGVVANIQRRLDKSADMVKTFNEMPQQMRYVYAAFYVLDDSKDSVLSEFFKKNGQPLTGISGDAVTAIFGSELGEAVAEEWERYDEDNEETSVIPEEIDKINKKFNISREKVNVSECVIKYVKDNITTFA